MTRAADASPSQTLLVHGTTIALDGRAALLRGPSGAGKSDLALRFLADHGRWPAPGGIRALVADDQTVLSVQSGRLVASAPPPIAGKIEVRGLGIVDVDPGDPAELCLVVDLADRLAVERMPAGDLRVRLLGHDLPRYALAPFEASAPTKLAILLTRPPFAR